MVILGLTGSIGMGKSTVAEDFRGLHVPVHEADRAVHGLLGKDGRAVAAVEAAFPKVVLDGAVDRQALAERVFDNPEALKRLEAILHPMVRDEEYAFLNATADEGRRLAVLDIPLLYETGAQERCDAVVVVSASEAVQRERVLERPGMTRQRFEDILTRQMPDAEKRRRADFVVDTGHGRSHGLREIDKIVRVTKRWQGTHWPPP